MTSALGEILMWSSWLYAMVAVFAARRAYRMAEKQNPDYFSSGGTPRNDPLNLYESRTTVSLIWDKSLQAKGFDAEVVKRFGTVRVMYRTMPIALILFFLGIILR
ncbi:hypothetical protein ARC20_07075 [Stenotrophomonas panacihumi]|uniref:Universal stress protein B n=1 Tax=Stenotrophomonas panacihumi TaxID=676599 RepID=A0A0R0AKW7_9GAMM|nr:hypothetical protein [Stenotrophomonas panacihumi]KRG45807.1 hypothetical protein ARC20_07075 [Stenotrophomonas panacihumi]PTN53362.1 hypothetical protein C9J98_15895 [Stenotrophomonas panacihumi]